MYHQIDEPPPRGTPLRGLVVAPSSFAWQMNLLNLMGYKGMSMRDLEPYMLEEKSGKVVGLTFDDGYHNNLSNALPILKEKGFTATCYAVSRMIGGANTWDCGVVAQKPLMSLEDLLVWRDAGMDIGSHSLTHADLNTLNAEAARDQIVQSKLEMESAFDCQVRHFCYPYGRFGDSHRLLVQEAGYISATTTRRGRVLPGDDLFTLRRVMVARATNFVQFLLKISSDYEDKRG
jgi:hypothetical protein